MRTAFTSFFFSACAAALLAGCAAAPADHHQPAVLTNAAQEREAAHDRGTARIFSERAKRIAPSLLPAKQAAAERRGSVGDDGDGPVFPLWQEDSAHGKP